MDNLERVLGALVEELMAEQLRNEIDKDDGKLLQEHEIKQALQGPLKSKIEEFTHFLQSNEHIMKLLQNEPFDEEQIKQKLWSMGEFLFQEELAKIVKEKVNISKEKVNISKRIERADPYLSDDEVGNYKGKRKIIYGGSLRIMDNLERVFGAFITA